MLALAFDGVGQAFGRPAVRLPPRRPEQVLTSEPGPMARIFWRGLLSGILGLLLLPPMWAQYEEHPTPLGDVARSLRKKEKPKTAEPTVPSRTVIDNDNLSEFMDEVASHRLAGSSPLYSIDGGGKAFQISGPDVTCSLSFNANASSLLARPSVPIVLPDDEMHKLDGPATITDDGLQVSVFNGTDWNIEEITVGLTVMRRASPVAGYGGSGRLVPAASETAMVAEKHSDVTTLHRLKGTALPFLVTVFKAPLSVVLSPDEEWHWAIIQAKGFPPDKLPDALGPNGLPR
jgi:hypothetical protein